ncbi:MAG: TetR/AcrR family transcriptional regulator [Chitinophaga sp.]|uniref:TetR/AcrR family transcriptional regulator n=1 Tax=Chitinophaga sp. TaxID=1869181 RepID=UPI0025C322F5|nr:TetR/AcrR family transcriptional regulator [Chitinophaga sp.]MBV8256033.1 TetR/AcrR family transcriptional regulator [Chitinophaga sp.]
MSKAEKTKAFIIEKCAPVFNKRGYAGTSLTDIEAATGLTKGALYGNFRDKNDIAKEAYHFSVGCLKQRYMAHVKSDQNAYNKLIAFTEYYRHDWKKFLQEGGCPIQNAAVESNADLRFLRPHVQKSIKGWAGFLADIIEEGKETRVLKPVNAHEYAFMIIMVLEGGIMLAKVMNNHAYLWQALDRLVKIINEELKR